MTREEKIQQHIRNRSREEKLEDMRESMWDWDMDSLIDSAFGHIEESMDKLTDEDFNDEYYQWFSCMLESEPDFDDDLEPENLVLDKCSCDLNQLMRGDGHNNNCPER